jgi:GTP cyclohydrolase I
MKDKAVTTEEIFKIQNHVIDIMTILGIQRTDGNRETPERIARMICLDMFRNRSSSTESLDGMMTLFDNPNRDNSSIVTIKDIKFTSFCEHHWLPFTGYADISYIPNTKILGLSKFPRVVKFFCQKPQVQERLVKEIGDYLVGILNPKELHVALRDVHHSCVEARGVESPCTTDTHYSYKRDI